MRTVIVGAGPTGMFLAMSLARHGHSVTLVDRDPGPAADDQWNRRGVMQFRHPHFFRPQVRDALLAEVPELAAGLVDAGALPTPLSPAMPDFLGFRMRRLTFERVLRAAAVAEPGVTTVVGNASHVRVDRHRVRGVVVDGRTIEADLVIDASGRTGRFADGLRAPGIGQDSGFAYVSREYQLLPDAEPGPLNSPPGWGGIYHGYLVIIFVQNAGTFQVLIVRPADDRELARLRHDDVFDTAAQEIPSIAAWVDPERAKPNGPTMVGGHLLNAYRGQLGSDGRPAAEGILFVGDAVLTTNPAAGRGVSTSLMHARHVLAALDEHGTDLAAVAGDVDQWCTSTLRPWYDDHVAWDAGLLSRWRGEDIDLDQPLPSDLICSLAEADQSVMPIVGAYQAMLAGPSVLAQIEERARANLKSGFRPSVPDGPTRDELAARIAHVGG